PDASGDLRHFRPSHTRPSGCWRIMIIAPLRHILRSVSGAACLPWLQGTWPAAGGSPRNGGGTEHAYGWIVTQDLYRGIGHDRGPAGVQVPGGLFQGERVSRLHGP